MLNKPVAIASITTLLGCIPLYILSSQEFTLTMNNLPLLALTLFVLVLVAVFWSRVASSPQSRVSTSRNSEAPRETGIVKWFNSSKGFGFITRDSGEDIFVHFRAIRGEGHRVLRDGQRVEFAISEGDKGLQADDVSAAR